MNFYLGVTNCSWFDYLSALNPEDVNFWQPGGKTAFRVLPLNGIFLFKLKKPYNAIGGLGFFRAQTQLPLSLAWDAFGVRNGVPDLDHFKTIIQKYRGDKERNPTIGCIALTDPVFFRREDWIPVPVDWSTSIVQGKRYSTDTVIGSALWQQVQDRLIRYRETLPAGQNLLSVDEPLPQYGNSVLQKVRIGQGAFRLSVIDVYTKRCAITGEKTLPVLEAAHIKPFAEAGPNQTSNGLLLRSDMHKLFDEGYITVTTDYRIEISSRIREEFSNGREYYQYHGKPLSVLPLLESDKPSSLYLDYHNTTIFRP